jgi:N-methylhydantoinase A/oxoprolinase/acetone carboxylase beta subunit
MYLGIDIGGTFTDLVLMDDDGNISTSKAPTTPGELEKGVFDAVAVVAGAQGLAPEELLGLPHVVGLDFKAMIAANNVASRRFHELMQRYGAETVDHVMRTEIDTSERLLRERLARIPDGVYRARDFLDHDGHANRV